MNKRNFITILGASLLTAAAFAKNPMVGGESDLRETLFTRSYA